MCFLCPNLCSRDPNFQTKICNKIQVAQLGIEQSVRYVIEYLIKDMNRSYTYQYANHVP